MLEIAVFLCGAVVMVIELTGSRVQAGAGFSAGGTQPRADKGGSLHDLPASAISDDGLWQAVGRFRLCGR